MFCAFALGTLVVLCGKFLRKKKWFLLAVAIAAMMAGIGLTMIDVWRNEGTVTVSKVFACAVLGIAEGCGMIVLDGEDVRWWWWYGVSLLPFLLCIALVYLW
jgi:hypothetical protein